MTATEILTLAPLGALVVAFGLQPGLLLDLVNGTVADTLASAARGSSYVVAPEVVVGGVVLIGALVVARIAWVLAHGEPAAPGAAGSSTAPAIAESGAAH